MNAKQYFKCFFDQDTENGYTPLQLAILYGSVHCMYIIVSTSATPKTHSAQTKNCDNEGLFPCIFTANTTHAAHTGIDAFGLLHQCQLEDSGRLFYVAGASTTASDSDSSSTDESDDSPSTSMRYWVPKSQQRKANNKRIVGGEDDSLIVCTIFFCRKRLYKGHQCQFYTRTLARHTATPSRQSRLFQEEFFDCFEGEFVFESTSSILFS